MNGHDASGSTASDRASWGGSIKESVMFRDRTDAGRRLAERVRALELDDPITLGLPRGGVVVAAEVADRIDSQLDVLIVRKLGLPFQPEVAMGAIGEDWVEILDWPTVHAAGVTDLEVAAVIRAERAEMERRSIHYRGMRPPISLAGRTALIVDDGIATGSSARAACRIARARGAQRVIVAVPVATPHTVSRMEHDCDDLVCLRTPVDFAAVGEFYRSFEPVSDEQVEALVERARTRFGARHLAPS
jgi:putative phosphoribosyl transferase